MNIKTNNNLDIYQKLDLLKSLMDDRSISTDNVLKNSLLAKPRFTDTGFVWDISPRYERYNILATVQDIVFSYASLIVGKKSISVVGKLPLNRTTTKKTYAYVDMDVEGRIGIEGRETNRELKIVHGDKIHTISPTHPTLKYITTIIVCSSHRIYFFGNGVDVPLTNPEESMKPILQGIQKNLYCSKGYPRFALVPQENNLYTYNSKEGLKLKF